MKSKLENSALTYEQIALELEKAIEHFKTTAKHLRDKEIPRASAHSLAGMGHIHKAKKLLKEEIIFHAENSSLN